MKQTFSQYLLEFRISVPQSSTQQVMNIVASGYFSYIAQLAKQQDKSLGQEYVKAMRQARQKYGDFKVFDTNTVQGTVQYDTSELPDRYKKGLNLKKSYPIKIVVGGHGDGTDNAAAYYPMGRGSSGSIYVNLSKIPGIDANPGSKTAIVDDLEELENMMAHELQHATQDVVLRKKHPNQMKLPSKEDDADTYYGSDIEFQPQITTAAGDFKRTLAAVRSRQEVTKDQVIGLMKAFLNPNAQMPQGMLKYKPAFQNQFFNSLYKNDPQKWKKAVKDFHRLVQSKI